MEAIKLQSMTDFVLKIDGIVKQHEDQDIDDWSLNCFGVIENYAKFLKQPLQLGMFVPCVDGKPIEYYNMEKTGGKFCKVGSEIEKEAKERVLFKGFFYKFNIDKDGKKWEYVKNEFPHVFSIDQLKRSTIEGLLTGFKEEYLIELTDSAIKQIGL